MQMEKCFEIQLRNRRGSWEEEVKNRQKLPKKYI